MLSLIELKTQIQYKLGLKLSAMPEEFELEILKTQIQYKLGLKLSKFIYTRLKYRP